MISDIAHRRHLDVVPLVQDAEQVAADGPKPIKPTFVVIKSSAFWPIRVPVCFPNRLPVVADRGISAVSKFLDDRGLVGVMRFFRSNRRRTEQAGPGINFLNTSYPTTCCTSIIL